MYLTIKGAFLLAALIFLFYVITGFAFDLLGAYIKSKIELKALNEKIDSCILKLNKAATKLLARAKKEDKTE